MSASLRDHLPALLAWLTRCAETGAVCPEGTAIAERFGAAAASGGGRLLALLEASGAITSERVGRGRVVTIVATGQSTARPFHMTPPGRRGDTIIGASA